MRAAGKGPAPDKRRQDAVSYTGSRKFFAGHPARVTSRWSPGGRRGRSGRPTGCDSAWSGRGRRGVGEVPAGPSKAGHPATASAPRGLLRYCPPYRPSRTVRRSPPRRERRAVRPHHRGPVECFVREGSWGLWDPPVLMVRCPVLGTIRIRPSPDTSATGTARPGCPGPAAPSHVRVNPCPRRRPWRPRPRRLPPRPPPAARRAPRARRAPAVRRRTRPGRSSWTRAATVVGPVRSGRPRARSPRRPAHRPDRPRPGRSPARDSPVRRRAASDRPLPTPGATGALTRARRSAPNANRAPHPRLRSRAAGRRRSACAAPRCSVPVTGPRRPGRPPARHRTPPVPAARRRRAGHPAPFRCRRP